ncbi:MAG: 2-oxoacid:ferredoxin oxidoreductase subunit beta [Alphaproteobacteria bacterium]
MADKVTAKDFASEQEVRWCPGCGDHAIVRNIQKLLADEGASRHNTAFVSGIGCAARFPYYMSTYGFHTLHGRAPAFATGAKLANPDLDVWVMGGDGDFLSIGGNHIIHLIRRNINVTCILFNNQIYGLTKGQASPTSRIGQKTVTTPDGVDSQPMNALALALGAGGRFIARTMSDKPKEMLAEFKTAHTIEGTAFVEVLQNCTVFNDGAFSTFSDRKTGADHRINVEHGKPMIFGVDGNKGLRVNPKTWQMEVVVIGENGISEDDILVHDETNLALAEMLVRLDMPDFPKVTGVIYNNPAPAWDVEMDKAYKANEQQDINGFFDFLKKGSWEV